MLIPIGIWLRRRSSARKRDTARSLSGDRPGAACRTAHRGVGRICNRAQSSDHWNGIVSRCGVHGFGKFLRDNLSHRDGSRVYDLSKFSALASGMRRMPYRARSGVVCALQAFRSTAGLCGNVPYLFAPIPSPVKYLRPARETCEQCHWPQRFTGDKFLVNTSYKDDEKNTPADRRFAAESGWPCVARFGRHSRPPPR